MTKITSLTPDGPESVRRALSEISGRRHDTPPPGTIGLGVSGDVRFQPAGGGVDRSVRDIDVDVSSLRDQIAHAVAGGRAIRLTHVPGVTDADGLTVGSMAYVYSASDSAFTGDVQGQYIWDGSKWSSLRFGSDVFAENITGKTITGSDFRGSTFTGSIFSLQGKTSTTSTQQYVDHFDTVTATPYPKAKPDHTNGTENAYNRWTYFFLTANGDWANEWGVISTADHGNVLRLTYAADSVTTYPYGNGFASNANLLATDRSTTNKVTAFPGVTRAGSKLISIAVKSSVTQNVCIGVTQVNDVGAEVQTCGSVTSCPANTWTTVTAIAYEGYVPETVTVELSAKSATVMIDDVVVTSAVDQGSTVEITRDTVGNPLMRVLDSSGRDRAKLLALVSGAELSLLDTSGNVAARVSESGMQLGAYQMPARFSQLPLAFSVAPGWTYNWGKLTRFGWIKWVQLSITNNSNWNPVGGTNLGTVVTQDALPSAATGAIIGNFGVLSSPNGGSAELNPNGDVWIKYGASGAGPESAWHTHVLAFWWME